MSKYKSPHAEAHKSHRAAWLRAAVLGVNDGIVSNASLMLGVLAADASDKAILTAGVAGIVAGALSMAAGEYVSVSSQRDSERADIEIERASLANNPNEELAELTWIYEQRGLSRELAQQVAVALHKHDAVKAHARDELGIDADELSKPLQAAFTSAVAFSVGSGIPVLAAIIAPSTFGAFAITVSSLFALGISGAIGAHVGGGHRIKAAMRVFVGGGIAMAITFLIGHLLGTAL